MDSIPVCTVKYAETSAITSMGLYGLAGLLTGLIIEKAANKPTGSLMWITAALGAGVGAYRNHAYRARMKTQMKNRDVKKEVEIIKDLTSEVE